MPDVSSARQRLKLSVRLIERHLSDLNLIFNKDLLGILGEEGTQYIDLSTIQEAVPALTEYTTAQLRRAIKYDAKDTLELHPDSDMVRRIRPFSEDEAVERMLFVDDIDISGHEEDPTMIFEQLLYPYPGELHGDHSQDLVYRSRNDSSSSLSSAEDQPNQDQEASDHDTMNQQTVIRPFGYKPTRFFQGFCYVEFATKELSSQMSNRILSRNNNVRVMPMKQWRKLESEYLSMRMKNSA
ncbi:hypothetical protein CPB97_006155 [Podila verticillata]|nr:hypothetical protein CPB97_006155 [Podila verticillata]